MSRPSITTRTGRGCHTRKAHKKLAVRLDGEARTQTRAPAGFLRKFVSSMISGTLGWRAAARRERAKAPSRACTLEKLLSVDGEYEATNSVRPQQASNLAQQGRLRQSLIHLRLQPERKTCEGTPRASTVPLPSHQRGSAAQEECYLFCRVADTVPQRADSS